MVYCPPSCGAGVRLQNAGRRGDGSDHRRPYRRSPRRRGHQSLCTRDPAQSNAEGFADDYVWLSDCGVRHRILALALPAGIQNIRVALTVSGALPVCPYKQTSSEPVGMSETCRQRKSRFARAGETYLSVGEKMRTISYMPGSNFAIVSASSRKGSGPGSRRMDS